MKLTLVLAALALVVIGFFINIYVGLAAVICVLLYALYATVPLRLALKGRKAYMAGDIDGAYEQYQKAVNTNRANSVIKLEYSDLLMQRGDFTAAETVLNGLIAQKQPSEVKNTLKLRRCMAYFKQGNVDEAYNDAKEIYENGFKNTYLYGLLGFFMLCCDSRSEETLNFCAEAYEYNDTDRDITDNYALALYYKGDLEKARELYDQITAENERFADGRYHSALVYYAMKDYKNALAELEKMSDCKWSPMTTVTKEEVEELKKKID